MKLNLGCGGKKLADHINVDCYPDCQPDQMVDLEQLPWPWESNSVDEIVLHHVLEHLGETRATFIGIMKEIWRVCKAGAKVLITVPDHRSDGFWGDPTHVRAITPHVLSLFSQTHNRETLAKGWPNTPLGLIHGIDFEVQSAQMILQPHWAPQLKSGQEGQEQIKAAVRDFNNVVDEIRFTLIVKK